MAAAALPLLACRPDTVSLRFEPRDGEAYRYRYEIEISVTRTVAGEAAETTDVTSTVRSEQRVVDRTEDGTMVEVTLTSDDGAPRTATVLLDRAGSLRAIQVVDGLPVDIPGLPAGAVPTASVGEPPDRPLEIGDEWTITDGTLTGDARLERLGVVDDHDVAVVRSSAVDVLTGVETVDDSEVSLDGRLRSIATTTFDLVDGAVRRASLRAHGRVDLLVAPPSGMDVPPVEAAVTYELRVRTTRVT